MTPEGKIQKYVMRRLREAGFLVRKLRYEGRNGAPDVLGISVVTVFVECKKDEDTQPEPHQLAEHARLKEHGAHVFVVGSEAQCDRMIQQMRFHVAVEKHRRRMAVLR